MVEHLPAIPKRGGWGITTGQWVKQYLEEVGEDYQESIHRHLKEFTTQGKARGMTYASFTRFFHHLKRLGLVEPSTRMEPGPHPALTERIYYRLTAKGRQATREWYDPLGTLYPQHAQRKSRSP